MKSMNELVSELEAAILSGDEGKLEEVFAKDMPVGYTDQLDAAARDMAQHMMEHNPEENQAVYRGGIEKIPSWLRRCLLENLVAWNLGRIKTCPHAPSLKTPQPSFMAAWEPRTVVCEDCLADILQPECGSPQDVLCDGCGMPLTNHKCKGINALVYGPTTLLYGVCEACAQSVYDQSERLS